MGLLDGRRAVITGGGSGIGRGVARAMIDAGALVVITDLDAAKGEAVAEALGADCTFFPHDVTSEASWERVLGQAADNLGGVDALVNCAGIFEGATIEDASLQHWRQVMSVNCEGVMLGCKHAVRVMKTSGGAIVNVASTAAERGVSRYVAYAASKAAVLSITRSTALHCAERGHPVRCNAVLPGATETPLLERHFEASRDAERTRDRYAAMHPVGRLGRPEDIAGAIVYLVSDAAAFVTGTSLPVDGGYLA